MHGVLRLKYSKALGALFGIKQHFNPTGFKKAQVYAFMYLN